MLPCEPKCCANRTLPSRRVDQSRSHSSKRCKHDVRCRQIYSARWRSDIDKCAHIAVISNQHASSFVVDAFDRCDVGAIDVAPVAHMAASFRRRRSRAASVSRRLARRALNAACSAHTGRCNPSSRRSEREPSRKFSRCSFLPNTAKTTPRTTGVDVAAEVATLVGKANDSTVVSLLPPFVVNSRV